MIIHVWYETSSYCIVLMVLKDSLIDSYYHLVTNYFNPVSLGDVTW